MRHGADWYKREPTAYLGGVQGMTAREHAVYSIILDLIYQHGGSVNNDPAWFAGWISDMGASAVRVTIAGLVSRGKLTLEDGQLVVGPEGKIEPPIRPGIPSAIREAVWQRDGEVCQYCDATIGPFHLDHVMPWSRGGAHSVENLVVSCATCNWSKGTKTLAEWLGSNE